jgi:MFS transporter, FSR family, fosmidomycin resistance protein
VRAALPQARFAVTGLLAALAVEFADELFDGTKSAALPLIKHDLALTYPQIGLLAAVPLVLGSLIELPLGVLSGTGGGRRRRLILAGGLVFIAAVAAAGLARSFPALLAALVVFFPASGAFVSLTQSALMDAYPDRRAQHMARWTLAGAVGAVAGPLLVAAVLAAGGSWRLAFLLVAAAGAVSWLAIAAAGPDQDDAQASDNDGEEEESGRWPGLRAAVRIVVRAGAVRWLLLLEASDLLLDVFTSFLALYLVYAVHASPAVAALGVAVRLGAGLIGYAVLPVLVERLASLRVLRASVLLAALLYPAFLLVPGITAKLVVLAVLSAVTAPWYPVLTTELYACLPGRSGLAVSLTSAAGLVGALGPLAVGLAAQHVGLAWAMAALAAVPVILLLAPARSRSRQATKLGSRD